MKRLVVVLLIIVLLVVGVLLTRKDSSSSIADVLAEPSSLFSAKQVEQSEQMAQHTAADTAAGSEADKISGVSSDFKNWISLQALELDKSSLNPQKIEDELTKRALQMTSQERSYLQALVLDQTSAGNQKILAVYVLGLDANGSQQQLEEIIKAPLVIGSDYATHSPEETLSMQEKTLRRLAIDSLVEKAKVEASYKNQLQAMAKDIVDPTLKRYLERKIQEIP